MERSEFNRSTHDPGRKSSVTMTTDALGWDSATPSPLEADGKYNVDIFT